MQNSKSLNLLVLAVVIFITYVAAKTETTSVKVESRVEVDKDSFDIDSMRDYIKLIKIKYPHIVEAQSVLESATYTSPIFKENNNLFGMKLPERRPTMALEVNRGHAVFKNWRESIVDYALFQSRILPKIHSEQEYFDYLDTNYSEIGDKYSVRLKRIIKELKLKNKK